MLDIKNENYEELFKRTPDKFYQLAIVDPPYGINFGNYQRTNKDKYGKRYVKDSWDKDSWDKDSWDKDSWDKYFSELQRVSVNQIVWGANYFWMPPTKGFIFWYKQNPVDNFSDGEYAWTSFQSVAKCFDYRYYGNLSGKTSAEERIHPTQKPVELYKWLLDNFAKEGDKILDTHLGSGSIAIACHDYKYELTACELNESYFSKTMQRINNHISQQKLF